VLRAQRMAVLAVALLLAHTSPDAAATQSRLAIPVRGALLGMRAAPRDGRTFEQQLEHVERLLGRRLAVAHFYAHWNDDPLDRAVRQSIAHHRIPLIDWDSEGTTWPAIVSGSQDARIRAVAAEMRAARAPILLNFAHEPEATVSARNPASSYAPAFRRVVTLFRAAGATNVRFVFILEAQTFATPATAAAFYPGNRYVNWIGADGYSWYPGRPGARWAPFKAIFAPFYHWGSARGKHLMVAETGVQEDPAARRHKARWFQYALRTLRIWPHIKAFVYFNSGQQYPWWFNTTIASRRAFVAIARTRYLGG
jgi:beta-mannanase